jgi:phage terminase Nu1 subunit (DNA packaging protein)
MQYHMFRDDKGALIPVSAEIAASHLDLSVTRFNDLVRQDILPREGRAKFDLDAVRVAYIRHIRDIAGGKKSGTDAPELTAERARLARAQADKAEMEVAALEGKLVPAESVEKVWTALTTSFRSRMVAMPGKLAHQLAAIQNPAEAEAFIRKSIYEALDELSNFSPEQCGALNDSTESSNQDETAAIAQS